MSDYSVVEDAPFKSMVEMIECIEEELEQGKRPTSHAWYMMLDWFKLNLSYAYFDKHKHLDLWYELLGETNAITRRIKASE